MRGARGLSSSVPAPDVPAGPRSDWRTLARLPTDPRLGRMLLEGSRRGCLSQMQVLVAGLSIPDVRERPTDHQQAADEMHRRFWAPGGPTVGATKETVE